VSTRRIIRSGIVWVLLLLLVGCVMSNRPMKAPAASGSVSVPAGMQTEAVFLCAEEVVQSLNRGNELWDKEVTRRDIASAILETGDFEEDNKSGFRLRMRVDPQAGVAEIMLKGAGAYFVDLGVDDGLREFVGKMNGCLQPLAR
jgi:hypothetical protein